MAASDYTIDVGEQSQSQSVRSRVDRLSRYDIVLAVIPSIFLVSILLGHLVSLPTQTAIVVGSLLGALAVVDALFVNPPGGDDS